jgi:probable biosynthetic protein (TIGR04099 family)
MSVLSFPENKTFHPASRDLLEAALAPDLLLGMPHLTPHGLSETWLMKELGHRHWLLLARELGMTDADFRSQAGEEVYAAICATSLKGARFGMCRANGVLSIHSSLSPTGRMQATSHHTLICDGSAVGRVELLSTFVFREKAEDNNSIARIPMPQIGTGAEGVLGADLSLIAKGLRKGLLTEHPSFTLQRQSLPPVYSFRPSDRLEFNGAGLFYCAYFQAVADRALAELFPEALQGTAVTDRDVFFWGNINPGDELTVSVVPGAGGMLPVCKCEIRAPGQKKIADVYLRTANRS